MSAVARKRRTFSEYVEAEEQSEIKHEFFDGAIFAMAGGTPEHSLIATNLAADLRERLRDRPCRVFNSDLRIRVAATGLSTYPDVTVVCGALERDPADERTITSWKAR